MDEKEKTLYNDVEGAEEAAREAAEDVKEVRKKLDALGEEPIDFNVLKDRVFRNHFEAAKEDSTKQLELLEAKQADLKAELEDAKTHQKAMDDAYRAAQDALKDYRDGPTLDLLVKTVTQSVREAVHSEFEEKNSVAELSGLSTEMFKSHRTTKSLQKKLVKLRLGEKDLTESAPVEENSFSWNGQENAENSIKFRKWLEKWLKLPKEYVLLYLGAQNKLLSEKEQWGLVGGTDIGVFPSKDHADNCDGDYLVGCIELKTKRIVQKNRNQAIGEAFLMTHHTRKNYWCILTNGDEFIGYRISGKLSDRCIEVEECPIRYFPYKEETEAEGVITGESVSGALLACGQLLSMEVQGVDLADLFEKKDIMFSQDHLDAKKVYKHPSDQYVEARKAFQQEFNDWDPIKQQAYILNVGVSGSSHPGFIPPRKVLNEGLEGNK